MHVFNARAIKAAGALQLPFTGGSDAHAPAEVGSCYTSFEEAVTRDNFISLLKAGRYQGVDIRKIGRKWIF
jgi:histidinol phosphatase-like PHP family hydrolase